MTAIVRDSKFRRSPLPQGQGGQVIPLHKSSVKLEIRVRNNPSLVCRIYLV